MEASKDAAARSWPIALTDVLAARDRIRPYFAPTPLRNYAPLDRVVGNSIQVWVKHENHCPTNSFKVRNALSVMTALREGEKGRGVIAATRGNHGLGVAFTGHLLGIPVTLCVPRGNNPEKNEGMRGYGATVLEEGNDYDEALEIAMRLSRERDLFLLHSTNDARVIAGAGTLTLEILEERTELDAVVVSVGGGSQAVGAMTVTRAMRPDLPVFAVQAKRASAIFESWRLGKPVSHPTADTFADGLATRNAYEMTFGPLREGLAGFVAVTESAIAQAVRTLLSTTHNLAEGAGAAGLAGVIALKNELAGKRVAIVLSGGNIDRETLRRVVNGDIA